MVQRYGVDVSGGAELHARYMAERLSSRVGVHVLTTCARDYLTWRNEFPPGTEEVNGVPVERFPVVRERRLEDFGIRSRRVFGRAHTLQEELDWLDSEGPVSPALVTRLRRSAAEFDFVLLFSVRYYQAYYGARAVPDRAVLVPTAEREPALGLAIFQPIFRGVRAIMYNSEEERAAINAVSGNDDVPGVVVGVGSAIPPAPEPLRARRQFGLHDRFMVYVGRIDANKGCAQLFDYYLRYLDTSRRALDLVLVGQGELEIPAHPRIRHLGYITDRDKFDVMAAAEALVMPSYYESLSMVALESWALGRPVLANARCDVLLGHCLRSHAGLYYESAGDFEAALDRLLDDPALADALGRAGRDYVASHYSWPVIEGKYLDMFERLASMPAARPMEPLPGWRSRRRANVPAAIDVVGDLPSGPVFDDVQEWSVRA
ncbi:MAG: glycosyltransferase family 4 protein [Acidobacteria bacterium]|nr:glycosyltransferase family 4 protein [Acidobacteriota bacterium]